MAKTVLINQVTYNNVSEVKLPLAEDPASMAVFLDTSDASASAADIKSGKTAYADGKRIEGTLSLPVISLSNGALSIS